MVELGIALTHELPDKTRAILLEEAACLAAAVSPKQALATYASIRDKHEGPTIRLIASSSTWSRMAT
jgi:hypothetical protein